MSDAPDMGSMDVTNAINPPETTTSDVPNQIPTPTPDPSADLQGAQSQTPQQFADANPPQGSGQGTPPAPPPQQPSLWRSVLSGALQGLAAGGSVNTRGMGSGAGFAAGAAAGAGQVLNTKPQQQAELDQTKATTALHYINLAKAQRDLNLMPDNKREQYLNQAADESDAMLKSGAITPMSQPGSLTDAQQSLQTLHAKNPWAIYSVMPIKGPDGIQYSAVQFGKAPLQDDLVLKGVGPDGGDITVPAGTPGDQVGKAYTTAFTRRVDLDAKKAIAKGNQDTRVKVQQLKNQGAVDVANIRATTAANAQNNKAPDMVAGTTSDGSQAAGSPAEMQAAGIKDFTKLPGIEGAKVIVARQLIDPNKGVVTNIENTINDLDHQGKLGVVASRWGAFMSGKVGNDPDFQRLSTLFGIFHTAVMQAHIGARATAEMMSHFKNLANPDISSPAQLRVGLQALKSYLTEKAMVLPGSPLDRAVKAKSAQAPNTNNGAAPNTNAAPAPMKGIQKSTGKPVVSNDGGKTWQLAQ